MKYLLALALFIPTFAFAQTDAADRDCQRQANGVAVDHPAKAMEAVAVAMQKCMRAKQLRQIGLYRGAQATCGDSAAAAEEQAIQKHLPFDREQFYSACMKGHNYVQ